MLVRTRRRINGQLASFERVSQHATSQHRGCHFIPISPSLDLLGTKDSIEALVESLRTTNEFKTGNVFIFGLVAHWARQPRPPRGKVGIMQLTNNADADINGSSIFPDGTAIWCRQSVANGDIARLVMAGAAWINTLGSHETSASSALDCRDVATVTYLPVSRSPHDRSAVLPKKRFSFQLRQQSQQAF
ncbi:hypothetical protein SCLCIDRAFT_28932 [Scleroderma citrinum Foug A]|uniref:Uncharacterized protein n=1 Tax=Scleroderma citrinum Foug A TaxID=1036808 RepID=A0A0C3DMR1_9AGAM|nr:hypothetical protein SCLCIDRAFT_28932 [Scleroderma citrinum Foug A]